MGGPAKDSSALPSAPRVLLDACFTSRAAVGDVVRGIAMHCTVYRSDLNARKGSDSTGGSSSIRSSPQRWWIKRCMRWTRSIRSDLPWVERC